MRWHAGVAVSDIRPLFGAMFHDLLHAYTHWGIIDADCLFADLRPLIAALPTYDVITFPDGVWHRRRVVDRSRMQIQGSLYLAGQLTVFRNIAYFRQCFGARAMLQLSDGPATLTQIGRWLTMDVHR